MNYITMFAAVFSALSFFTFLVLPSIPDGLLVGERSWWQGGWDVTDDVENERASGLILYVDHGTGVHYVGNRMGGLSVRVDVNGLPMSNPDSEGE